MYRVVILCYTFVQASQLCTKTRAKKVIVGLAVVAVCVGCFLSHELDLYPYYVIRVIIDVVWIVSDVVVPVTVLIINAMLIREVRRAANNASANFGVQQHHQSTSSNSAVPTVMLITTSLVYVLLRGSYSISYTLSSRYLTDNLFLDHCNWVLFALARFVFAYNFFVYLITGKQFRSELRTLFCRSSCSSSAAAAAAARDRNDVRLAIGGQAETVV